MPEISVVMAVYNGERFLRPAVDSILAQTFRDFEFIVVDDGSTDGTAAILDSYDDPRLVCLRNKTNLGQTRSLNVGLGVARGDLIARQDADDISHPERFRHQVEKLATHPAIGLLGTSYDIIGKDGQVLETIQPPTTNLQLQEELRSGNSFCHGSVMIRRQYLERAGGYNENFLVTQDYDLWLRLAEHCELANLETPLYQYRFDGETVTRQKRDLQLAYRRLARTLAEQRRQQGKEEPLPEDVLRAYPPEPVRQFGDARWAAYLFYAAGQKKQARESLEQAVEVQRQQQMAPLSPWQRWALARAHVLSRLRDDTRRGVEFIVWLSQIPGLGMEQSQRKIVATFYVEQAFSAYRSGHKEQVPSYFWKAVRRDLNWLTNKGLWAISWKSLIAKRH